MAIQSIPQQNLQTTDIDLLLEVSLESRVEKAADTPAVKAALDNFFAELEKLNDSGVPLITCNDISFLGTILMCAGIEAGWRDGYFCAKHPGRRIVIVE